MFFKLKKIYGRKQGGVETNIVLEEKNANFAW